MKKVNIESKTTKKKRNKKCYLFLHRRHITSAQSRLMLLKFVWSAVRYLVQLHFNSVQLFVFGKTPFFSFDVLLLLLPTLLLFSYASMLICVSPC